MADLYYDTEFLERGPAHPIDLISIGLVADDGDELYLISSDFDRDAVAGHDWLMRNVVGSLPFLALGGGGRVTLEPDPDHPDYDKIRPRAEIAKAVKELVLSRDDPRLWAWYGAYDHVVLAQLFGTMTGLPEGFPMHTCDLKQEVELLGNPKLPTMPGATGHRAIDDAREVKYRREWLAQHFDPGGPRWPSMRLVRDVDDFTVGQDEDGEMGLWCPSEPCGGGRYEGQVRVGDLLTDCYAHIDRKHQAAAK